MRLIFLSVTALTTIVLSGFTVLNSTGVINATGSPIDGRTCGDCHSGAGSATPSFTLTATPAFGTGNTYVAGTTYTIDLSCSGAFAKFGFDLELLNSTSPVSAGDAGICGTALLNSQKITSAGNPTNYTHTAPTGIANAADFQFQWTAPDSGNVFIYAAVLGVNNNGTATGDHLKLKSLTLSLDLSGITFYQDNLFRFHIFPNPAMDNFHVSYFLQERSNVFIKLFDLNGEITAILLSAAQDRGRQSVEMHFPKDMAKGMYILKLTVNGKQTLQKLIIL